MSDDFDCRRAEYVFVYPDAYDAVVVEAPAGCDDAPAGYAWVHIYGRDRGRMDMYRAASEFKPGDECELRADGLLHVKRGYA